MSLLNLVIKKKNFFEPEVTFGHFFKKFFSMFSSQDGYQTTPFDSLIIIKTSSVWFRAKKKNLENFSKKHCPMFSSQVWYQKTPYELLNVFEVTIIKDWNLLKNSIQNFKNETFRNRYYQAIMRWAHGHALTACSRLHNLNSTNQNACPKWHLTVTLPETFLCGFSVWFGMLKSSESQIDFWVSLHFTTTLQHIELKSSGALTS